MVLQIFFIRLCYRTLTIGGTILENVLLGDSLSVNMLIWGVPKNLKVENRWLRALLFQSLLKAGY